MFPQALIIPARSRVGAAQLVAIRLLRYAVLDTMDPSSSPLGRSVQWSQ